MILHDIQYLEMVDTILKHGTPREERTGTGVISSFGHQLRFDLRDGSIPLLTTKKMHTKSIIHEILWYLSGSDNIQYLKDNGVTIWDAWADADGNLGPVYGKQWREWRTFTEVDSDWPEDQLPSGEPYFLPGRPIDQIAGLIDTLKTNPNDRRMIVSAWNVGDLGSMNLPPCHYAFQCYARPLTTKERVLHMSHKYYIMDMMSVSTERMVEILNEHNCPTHELSLMLNQRSCDVFLGVPFNICQYSILLHMIAEVVNMAPGQFIWNGGDVHIYNNHIPQLTEQLRRDPYQSPTLRFVRDINNIDDFVYDDFVIQNYEYHPILRGDVAV